MSVDRKLISRKISFINKDLKELNILADLPLEQYLSKPEYEVLAERYLERIIGRMIDVNYHILSEEKGETPTDYFNSFVDLGKAGFLPRKLAERLANSAGLRNRLAHEYDEIDEKKIYEAIKIAKVDVAKYLQEINKGFGKDLE